MNNTKNKIIELVYLPKPAKVVFKNTVFKHFHSHAVIKSDLNNVILTTTSPNQQPIIKSDSVFYIIKKAKIFATVTSQALDGLNFECPIKIGSPINPYSKDFIHYKGVILDIKDNLNNQFNNYEKPIQSCVNNENIPYYIEDINTESEQAFKRLLINLTYCSPLNDNDLRIISSSDLEDEHINNDLAKILSVEDNSE